MARFNARGVATSPTATTTGWIFEGCQALRQFRPRLARAANAKYRRMNISAVLHSKYGRQTRFDVKTFVLFKTTILRLFERC